MAATSAVFDMLDRCGLKIHPEKTLATADCIELLGYMVGCGHLFPMQAKVAAIQQCFLPPLLQPGTVPTLWASSTPMLLFSSFVPNFAMIAARSTTPCPSPSPPAHAPAQAVVCCHTSKPTHTSSPSASSLASPTGPACYVPSSEATKRGYGGKCQQCSLFLFLLTEMQTPGKVCRWRTGLAGEGEAR